MKQSLKVKKITNAFEAHNLHTSLRGIQIFNANKGFSAMMEIDPSLRSDLFLHFNSEIMPKRCSFKCESGIFWFIELFE